MGRMRLSLLRLFLGTGMVGALTGLGFLAAPMPYAATTIAGMHSKPQDCHTAPGDTFETPVVTPGTFRRLSAGQAIGPWTVTRNDVDLIGAGFWQAADGVQSLDLDGSGPGGVARTFATASFPLPLFTYVLSYCLAGNTDSGPTVKTGQVLVNDVPVQDFSFNDMGKSRSNMGYQPATVSFTSPGPDVKVEFRSTTNPGGYGPVIDKVTFKKCLLGLFCF